MKSYVIIGLGLFGQALARQLCTLGAEVLAMDIRSDLVQQVANDVTHAVVGDAQDKEVLRALGVRDMDCAVIAIGDDLAASVLTTMNLKELGVPYIVCKAHDETHRRVLEKLGGILQPHMAGADVTCRIPVTHFFPVLLQFWEGDEEFPPKLMLLWDRNADKFLHFETTFFLQGDLLERLKNRMEETV